MSNETCLALMFKAPARSKRRLAQEIGAHRALRAAEHLLACAIADIAAWSGPTCLAPAAGDDAEYARAHGYAATLQFVQGDGNLGSRIASINASLTTNRLTRQLFIGSDCPMLDSAYIESAAAALRQHDVVLGPATDGGVVLMGIRGLWPPLEHLPWSSPALGAELRRVCESTQLRVAILAARSDVDTADDLRQLPERLSGDGRATRRALCAWIEAELEI